MLTLRPRDGACSNDDGEMIEPTPGTVIAGRYRLERELGAGGMGVVWSALDVNGGGYVALKLLRAADDDAQSRRRFIREARAATAVRHPHVVTVHDVVLLDDGTPVIVMELLEGEPLSAKLRREKRLSVAELARILLPVVSAVGTAHTLGIVHRDIKPDNIFLSREGDREIVKVVDFGIAKLTIEGDGEKTGGMTTTGTMLGTPLYMSPEQAFGEKDVDYRSDIWSLGILVYKCLAGKVPTYADNVGQILKIILSDKIPPLDEKAPGTPEDIVLLVRKMLQIDRHDRPADLREVQAVLAPYAPTVTVPAFGEAVIPPPRSSSKLLSGSDGRVPTADTLAERETKRATFDRTKRMMPSPSSMPGAGHSNPPSETSVGVQVAEPRSIDVAPASPWRARIAVAAGVVMLAAGTWVLALRTAHPVAAAGTASGEPVRVAAAQPPPPGETGTVVGASAGATAEAPAAPAVATAEVGTMASARPAAVTAAVTAAKKLKPVAAAPLVTAPAAAAAPSPNTNNGKFVEKPPF